MEISLQDNNGAECTGTLGNVVKSDCTYTYSLAGDPHAIHTMPKT